MQKISLQLDSYNKYIPTYIKQLLTKSQVLKDCLICVSAVSSSDAMCQVFSKIELKNVPFFFCLTSKSKILTNK